MSSRWVRKVKEIGLAHAVAHGLRLVFRTFVFRRDELLVFSMKQVRRDDSSRSTSVTDWRWLEEGVLRDFQTQQAAYFSERRMTIWGRRLLAGNRAYGLLEGARLVNLGWVRIEPEIRATPEVGDRLTIPLATAEPIIYDCWTPPEHRGNGHYATALQQTSDRLLQTHPRVWIYCLPQNQPSARGIVNAGFTLHSRLTRIRICGLERRTSRRIVQ